MSTTRVTALDQLSIDALFAPTRSTACGVLVIVIGVFIAATNFARHRRHENPYRELRSTLGRAILFGLERLVAADITNTAAIDPTISLRITSSGSTEGRPIVLQAGFISEYRLPRSMKRSMRRSR